MPKRLKRLKQLRRAQMLGASGDGDGALAAFRALLRDDPGDAVARAHLALALADRGDFAAAVEEARRAAADAPERPSVRLMAGRVFYDAGDYDAAAAEFDAVLSASPDNDLAQGYRVLAGWAAGDAEGWRKIRPDNLPDSAAFLVRWLERVEMEARPLLADAASKAEASAVSAEGGAA